MMLNYVVDVKLCKIVQNYANCVILLLGKTLTFHHFRHTPTKLDLNFFFIVPYVESGDVNYRSTQRCRRYLSEVHGGKPSVEAGVDSDDQPEKFDH